MKWYMAKIVYQIICGDGEHTPQFDEQLRLIHADNNLHAFHKARDIGRQEEDCFLNYVNKPVQWKFIDVSEIHLLDVLTDGAEVYSKICEEENEYRYIHSVRLKAALLLESGSYQSTGLN
jgi:hypothetical protein